MGYYLNADVSLEFVSPEALIRAGQALAGDETTVETRDDALDLIWAAWSECGEDAEFVDYPDEPLKLSGYSSGKWYDWAYDKVVAALKDNVVGVIDFYEEAYVMWRERFHRDGTVTKHDAVITYEGDEEE